MKIASKLLLAIAVSSVLATNISADALADKGKKIFETNTQGNCIACHAINGKTLDGPGSFGPQLTGLKHWDDKSLTSMIYDPSTMGKGEITAMPPFGKSGWLSDDEIKAVVAFLKTIE